MAQTVYVPRGSNKSPENGAFRFKSLCIGVSEADREPLSPSELESTRRESEKVQASGVRV
jgi:hypothetical protein